MSSTVAPFMSSTVAPRKLCTLTTRPFLLKKTRQQQHNFQQNITKTFLQQHFLSFPVFPCWRTLFASGILIRILHCISYILSINFALVTWEDFRCSRLQMFFKKSVPKNLATRTEKHLKENTQRPPTLLKRDPNTGVFLPNGKFCKNSFR